LLKCSGFTKPFLAIYFLCLFTLISSYTIVFSFALMFTDSWFTYCTMAFCIASAF